MSNNISDFIYHNIYILLISIICILTIHVFVYTKKYIHSKNGNNKRTCIIDEGGDKNEI